MKDLKKFVKSTGIYLLGNVLNKALSFLLLPVYTRYLSPADFGTYDLNIAYNSFLFSIIFLDIYGVIMRFMFDYDKEGKNKPIFNGLIIFLMSTVLYLIGVLILGNLLGIEYKMLLFAMGLTNNLQLMVGYIARAEGKNGIFVLGGLFGSVTTLVLNIVLIVNLSQGYWVLYFASSVGFLVNALVINKNIKLFKRLKIKLYDKLLLKEMMIYALPLSINSAAYWFLTGFNRVIISNQLSLMDNGFYAVATKFSAIIQLITQCFQMAWQELTFSKANMKRKEMSVFYSKAVNEYINFLYIGLILSLPVIKIIFPYMIDEQYREAMQLIPIALYATFFSSISSFLASIISTLKKNQYIFTTTVVAAVVNIIVILSLINFIGVQAANVSLCVGFLVNVIRRIQLINKFLSLKINYIKLIQNTFLFAFATIVYMYGSFFLNSLMFIVFLFIAFYSYRDKLLELKNSFF